MRDAVALNDRDRPGSRANYELPENETSSPISTGIRLTTISSIHAEVDDLLDDVRPATATFLSPAIRVLIAPRADRDGDSWPSNCRHWALTLEEMIDALHAADRVG